MPLETTQIAAALDQIAEHIESASASFEEFTYTDNEWARGSGHWHINLAYLELLVLAEALQLPLLRTQIAAAHEEAQKDMSAMETGPDGDLHAVSPIAARRFHRALQETLVIEPTRTITKDIESILRAATYSITDSKLFSAPPRNESEVHDRVEAVLRCLFPDLQRKPRLGKPIKNFEPDTGLPSIGTLIEFKYISDRTQVAAVADEVLADTRGYRSAEWHSFVFAIYETQRFRQEAEWRQILRECGAMNASAVVMHGEPRNEVTRREKNST